MITVGAKFYFGLAALAMGAAIAYSWGSRGGLTGALTFGFYGGVGDHTGYVVLLAAAVIAMFLGITVVAFRDADADAVRQVAHTDAVPEVPAPKYASYWPLLGAAALACVVVGLVSSSLLVIFGVVVGIVVLLEWMVSAWADRATGDPEVNRRIRNRLMNPIEIPLFGAIGAVALVVCISRVLLAASEVGSAVVAMVVAVTILALASVYAAAPKAGRTIVVVLCVLAGLGVITSGIISAAQGSRDYEKHEADHITQTPDRRQPQPTSSEEN